jgi:hypothetical protein
VVRLRISAASLMVRTASRGGYAKFGLVLPIGPAWHSGVETAVLDRGLLGRSDASYCRLCMAAVTAFELLRDSPFRRGVRWIETAA